LHSCFFRIAHFAQFSKLLIPSRKRALIALLNTCFISLPQMMKSSHPNQSNEGGETVCVKKSLFIC
jgi:hypothetical protein